MAAQGAGLTDKLLAAQRAWLTFRDAECALEVARWGEGTLAGVVGAIQHGGLRYARGDSDVDGDCPLGLRVAKR